MGTSPNTDTDDTVLNKHFPECADQISSCCDTRCSSDVKLIRRCSCPSGLPVWQARNDFIDMIHKSQTTILVGETGSGKTTQIAQFIHDAGYTQTGKMVCCTQPRRSAFLLVPLEQRRNATGHHDAGNRSTKDEAWMRSQSLLMFPAPVQGGSHVSGEACGR